MDAVEVEGIQAVTGRDIEAWRLQGRVAKLVGSLVKADGTFHARVGIKTYPLSDAFAYIQGKNKAIRITTDAMGETIAIGSGKEPLATAAAALKDFEHILTARMAKSLAH